MGFNYHWSKTEILDHTFLDEAFFYIDQITAEQIKRQLIDIQVACTPYYSQNDRSAHIAKLQYQLGKALGKNEDDAQDVDPATVKRNLGILKNFFGKKRKQKGT